MLKTVFLKPLQNIFILKNTLEKLLRQLVPNSVLWLYIFKIQRRIQHPVKHLRCFCKKLIVRCLTRFRISFLKKAFKVLSFLNPLLKLVTLLKVL